MTYIGIIAKSIHHMLHCSLQINSKSVKYQTKDLKITNKEFPEENNSQSFWNIPRLRLEDSEGWDEPGLTFDGPAPVLLILYICQLLPSVSIYKNTYKLHTTHKNNTSTTK